jgi:glycosyltransferase involved in cell wall biosynthesis
MRILVVNNIPAPYFDPLFEKIGSENGWSLTVCYTSTWNQQAGWVEAPIATSTYRTEILDRAGRSILAGARLVGELARNRPDFLIIYGYTLIPQVIAILWSMVTGSRYALIGDANIHTDKPAGLKRGLRRWWIRHAVKQAAAIIAIGTANRRFWIRYGARQQQLFDAPYAVDNEYFQRAVASARREIEGLRESLRIPSGTVFLFVGRLIRRKNVDLIIRAVRATRSRDVALVIVGDGDERERLQALAEGDPRIAFAGAISQTLLPGYYAMADCLVLPASGEPWGLVVNEAMASGLAVIVHRDCGAAVDLISPENGVVLESFEVQELQRALESVSDDPVKLGIMKRHSLARISKSSIDRAAASIIEAVKAVMPHGAEMEKEQTSAHVEGVVEEIK